jgi:hypothetical protein
MSNTEMLVFIYLVALADKETGSGTINAPTLRAFLPGLSHDAAKRVLCSLESKGYVFRDITPFSKQVYRFWVNKYQPTVGKYKLLQTNISKALESRDVNDIEYVDPALETAPVSAPVTAPVGALYYKKGEERIEKDNPNTISSECASERALICEEISAQDSSQKRSQVESASAHKSAHKSAPPEAHKNVHQVMHQTVHQNATQAMHQNVHQDVHQSMHQNTTHVKDALKPLRDLVPPEDLGMRWCEQEKKYRDADSGRLLSDEEFQTRFAKGTAA